MKTALIAKERSICKDWCCIRLSCRTVRTTPVSASSAPSRNHKHSAPPSRTRQTVPDRVPSTNLSDRAESSSSSPPGGRRSNTRREVLGTARYKAVQQLLRIEEEGAYADIVHGTVQPAATRTATQTATHQKRAGGAAGAGESRDSGAAKPQQSGRLSDRDERLVTQLVSGVTRWRKRLDFTLGHVTSRSAASIDPGLRQVLRIGLYELQHCDLPPHALSEHVDLGYVLKGEAGAGLINWTLRTATRQLQAGTLPVPQEPDAGAGGRAAVRGLALSHSHPTWMVTRWWNRFGREATRQLLVHNNRSPVYGLRINSPSATPPASLLTSLMDAGVEVEPSPLLPQEFLRVKGGMQALLKGGLVAQGVVGVQDEAAGLVVALLDPQPGDYVLDGCAAPGGKTLFAAARMKGQGKIVAVDVSASRLRAVATAARQLGNVGDAIVIAPAADLCQFAHHHLQRCSAETAPSTAPPALTNESWRTTTATPTHMHPNHHTSTSAHTAAAAAATAPSSSPASASDEGSHVGDDDGPFSDTAGTDLTEDMFPLGGPAIRDFPAGAGHSRWMDGGGGCAPPPASLFDRVLLDAPCSGTGVLAKRADLRWRRSLEQLQQLLELQDRLLDAAAQLVRPGGVLVYSTCSIEEDEGGDRVRAFLERHPGEWVVERPRPGSVPEEVVTEEGWVMTLPHVHQTDGAFAAKLRRQG